MKITPSYLYLSLLLCLLSYAPLDAQEAFNDSVALIKRNYINATVGKDKGKEVLLRQLSTIPPEKEASDQNVIELQQLYPISPKEIKHLINTLIRTVHGKISTTQIRNVPGGNRKNIPNGY